MTPERLRDCLNALGYDSRDFAAVAKVDDRRVRRWLKGHAEVRPDIAAWLEGYIAYVLKHIDRYPKIKPPPAPPPVEAYPPGSAMPWEEQP